MLKHISFGIIFTLFMQLSAVSQVYSSENNLQQLLQPFKSITFIHFTYTQKRYSLFFKQPQESRGEIIFEKPDTLTKRELQPHQKTYQIQNNQLSVSEYDKNKQLSKNAEIHLSNYPQLQQFVDLYKALLSGNADFLAQHYSYQIQNHAENWDLQLTPLPVNDVMNMQQQRLKTVQITASKDKIQSIHMLGHGGEKSELYIDKIIRHESIQ